MAKSKKETRAVSVEVEAPATISVKPDGHRLPILRPLPQPLHDRKIVDDGTGEVVFFAGDFIGKLRKYEEFSATGIRIECSADAWFHADVHFGFGASTDWLTAPMSFFKGRTVSLERMGIEEGKQLKSIQLTYDEPCKLYVKIAANSAEFFKLCPLIIDVYIEGTRYSYV
jgi:hypothetical protein